MSQHNSRDLFAVTLVAAAAGFVAGILFAPKKGSETIEDLRYHADRLEAQARKGVTVARETAAEGAKELKKVVTEASHDAKELAADAKVRAKRTVSNLEHAAKDVESKARSAWSKS